jgi:hypothetical protein
MVAATVERVNLLDDASDMDSCPPLIAEESSPQAAGGQRQRLGGRDAVAHDAARRPHVRQRQHPRQVHRPVVRQEAVRMPAGRGSTGFRA